MDDDDAVQIPEEVAFNNHFFHAVEGTFFRMVEESDTPVMVTPLETGPVDLKFVSVKKELGLADDDPDWQMLQFIEEALKYVQGLRIGDPFPSEMTSGKPSWDVTDQHRKIAQSRISIQLVTWMSGDEEVLTDTDRLAGIIDKPGMKEKINEAFGAAAEALGMDRDNREEVISLVSGLAEELAAIEAVRERFERITLIEDRLQEISKNYSTEDGAMESIIRVSKLLAIAMQGFRDSFEKIDAQTSEIMTVLGNMARQVKMIRARRDDLHRRLWAWDALVARWEQTPANSGPDIERVVQETYQFLAQRFLPQKEWELFTKALDNKQSTESVW